MESLEPCRVVTVGEVLGGYGVRSRIRLVRIRRMVIHRLSGGASMSILDQDQFRNTQNFNQRAERAINVKEKHRDK